MPTVASVTSHASAAGMILAISHDYIAMSVASSPQPPVMYISKLDIGMTLPKYFTALIQSKIGSAAARRDVILERRRSTQRQLRPARGHGDRAYTRLTSFQVPTSYSTLYFVAHLCPSQHIRGSISPYQLSRFFALSFFVGSAAGKAEGRRMSTQAQPWDSNFVRICIRAQDGSDVCYEVKSRIQVRAFLLQYCKDKGVEYESTNFVFKDRPLLKNGKTISQVGLVDRSQIEAMTYQNGG